jgi:hypothetical protein
MNKKQRHPPIMPADVRERSLFGLQLSAQTNRYRCTLSGHKSLWEGHSLKGATNEWTVYGRRHTFFPPAVADRGKKAPKADTALFLNHNKHDANQYKYTQRECRFSIARELKKKTKASLDLTRTNVKSLSQQSAAVALFVTLSAICRIHTHKQQYHDHSAG